MRRRQVARGRAARDRRYEAAIHRQVDAYRRARHNHEHPRHFLRPGDTLDRFTLTHAVIHT